MLGRGLVGLTSGLLGAGSDGRCSSSGPHGLQGGVGLLLQHGPVEGVVVLVVQRAEQDAEQLPQVHVVRGLVETEATAVIEVHGKLRREALSIAFKKYYQLNIGKMKLNKQKDVAIYKKNNNRKIKINKISINKSNLFECILFANFNHIGFFF